MSEQSVTWEEPALFDAPVTHMPVPLAVRVTFEGHPLNAHRWVPLHPSALSDAVESAIEGDVAWVEDVLYNQAFSQIGELAQYWGVIEAAEVERITHALVERRMMPIPGGAR